MLKQIADYLQKQSKWFWATVLITLIVDALNSTYFEVFQNYFYNILDSKNQKSIYSIIIIYVLFILLLVIIGMMSSYENREYYTKKQKRIKKISDFFTGIMILGYGIILLMPSANILGMGDEQSIFTQGQQQTYFMLLIALFFIMIVFAFINFKTRFVFGAANYFYAYLPVLILATLFVDYSTALFKYQLFNPDDIADPERSSRILEFLILFPFYALFYSAPRFILLRKSYNILPILSAIFSTAYFVWKSLEYLQL